MPNKKMKSAGKPLLAFVAFWLIVGGAGATMLTSGMSVPLSAVTFANHYQFDHEFTFFCTECEQYSNVSDTDIAKANALISKTNGIPLISCSHCGKVYYLPDQVLAADDDWIECLPYTGIGVVEPMGSGIEMPPGSGLIMYAGGNGPIGEGLQRAEYMAAYGWDPAVMWQHMSMIKGVQEVK